MQNEFMTNSGKRLSS